MYKNWKIYVKFCIILIYEYNIYHILYIKNQNMLDIKGLWHAIKEYFWGDKKTREDLIEVKKNIVEEFINSLKKNKKEIDNNVRERLENYLINDGTVEDVFQDIFRWCMLSFNLPEYIDNINEVKKIISSIQEKPTAEKLDELKAEIMNFSTQSSTASQTTSNHPTTNIEIPAEIKEQENKFIKSVYERASQQIWKPYSRWWTSPITWFDCSGLRYRAFKEEWIRFSQRLTAHKFSDADVDIRKNEVKPWDFMFWDQQPWRKKHNSIYHIEMVISKPYTKNWKIYVRTLWSSTDIRDDGGNYVGRWVQIREREMKDYRHYWRPTYYYQLAQHEVTWSRDNLIAWSNRPSQDLQNQVLSA